MGKYSKPKKNAKNKETGFQQFATFMLEMLITIYVIIMFTIYPLFYHNKYFDMGGTKYVFFAVVTVIFIGFSVVGAVLWVIANAKVVSFEKIIRGYSITDWFAIAFLFISFLSFAFSEDKQMALFGFNGWNMGFLSQLAFVLIYFFVSRFWKWNPTTLIAGLITAAITYFLAVIMRFGFDPLSMYENIRAIDIEKFISTLGQTTWYSSYAVLMFPVGIYYFMYDDKKWIKIFSAIFIVLGSMSLCVTNSDSAYIAFALIMMAYFWFALESNETFSKFLDVAVMILLSCKLVGILQDIFPERLLVLLTGEEKITKFVTHSTFMTVLAAVFIILDLAFKIINEKNDIYKNPDKAFNITKFKGIRKIVVYLFIVAVWAVVLLIILTTNHKLPAALDKLYSVDFFVFNDLWGNCRGFNWTAAIKAFSHSSFKDVLVGVGPDCFDVAMNKYYQQEVAVFWNGLHLACAHNEFLNMLVTEGVLGLVAYLGIMISSAKRCAMAASKEPAAIFVVAIVAAYIGHNVFCYQQCICTPVLFIFLGIGEVIIRETKKSENVK